MSRRVRLAAAASLVLATAASCSKDSRRPAPTPVDAAAPAHTCPPPGTPGLELCVSFEHATGQTVEDESGKGLVGRAIGNVTFGSDGHPGKAAAFVGDPAAGLDFGQVLSLPGPVTVQAWLKPSALNRWGSAVNKWTQQTGYWLGLSEAPGGFEWWVDDVYAGVTTGAATSVWHHLAGTYDPVTGELALYLDGKLAASVLYQHVPGDMGTNEAPFTLGTGGDEFSPWQGVIDEVEVWNLVRSQVDICTDAGGPNAPSGSCVHTPSVLGADADYVLEQLALAALGTPADLNHDGNPEYTRALDGNGVLQVALDTNGDGQLECSAQIDSSGNAVITIDTDQDGYPESETNLRPGPPRQKTVRRDTDFDQFFDRRITSTYDEVAGQVRTIVEADPTEQGTFQVVYDYTHSAIEHQLCCPCGCPSDSGDGGAQCDEGIDSFPTASQQIQFNNVVIHYNDTEQTGADGSCSKRQMQLLLDALRCSLTTGIQCLESTNAEMSFALAEAFFVPTRISCGNQCVGTNASVRLGDRTRPALISFNQTLLEQKPANAICEVMLHELLHVGGGGVADECHDCGGDEVYSCARLCTGCSDASRRPADWNASYDCAKCYDTPGRKEAHCGYQETFGTISNQTASVCHQGLSCVADQCDSWQGVRRSACDGTVISEAPSCCARCPAGCEQNDLPCTMTPPLTNTCGQSARSCQP